MAKTEYKVGETFQFGLKTLKCVHDKIYECENCALRSMDDDCERFVGPCTANSRTDGLAVIFIEGEEKESEWPLEGVEAELQPCPVRLIDCVYHDKEGLARQCLIVYSANGWVPNKELVTELVRERKKDFKELVTFQIR